MKIASLILVVEGMGVCPLWVLVWGLQILFPCVTFLTRSVRLHPVCIRLAWHWVLILMEKGYCDFHKHCDRLSFLAWLEVSGNLFLQMLVRSRAVLE